MDVEIPTKIWMTTTTESAMSLIPAKPATWAGFPVPVMITTATAVRIRLRTKTETMTLFSTD